MHVSNCPSLSPRSPRKDLGICGTWHCLRLDPTLRSVMTATYRRSCRRFDPPGCLFQYRSRSPPASAACVEDAQSCSRPQLVNVTGFLAIVDGAVPEKSTGCIRTARIDAIWSCGSVDLSWGGCRSRSRNGESEPVVGSSSACYMQAHRALGLGAHSYRERLHYFDGRLSYPNRSHQRVAMILQSIPSELGKTSLQIVDLRDSEPPSP